MSNTVGHTLPQQALYRPSIKENQSKARQGVSANFLCGVPLGSKVENAVSYSSRSLLSTGSLGKKLIKGIPPKQNPSIVTMTPRAVLAADPASEVSLSLCFKKYTLLF